MHLSRRFRRYAFPLVALVVLGACGVADNATTDTDSGEVVSDLLLLTAKSIAGEADSIAAAAEDGVGGATTPRHVHEAIERAVAAGDLSAANGWHVDLAGPVKDCYELRHLVDSTDTIDPATMAPTMHVTIYDVGGTTRATAGFGACQTSERAACAAGDMLACDNVSFFTTDNGLLTPASIARWADARGPLGRASAASLHEALVAHASLGALDGWSGDTALTETDPVQDCYELTYVAADGAAPTWHLTIGIVDDRPRAVAAPGPCN